MDFPPAFLETETGVVYASCYADGRRAPFHLLDGLPNELVLERDPTGRVAAVKAAERPSGARNSRDCQVRAGDCTHKDD